MPSYRVEFTRVLKINSSFDFKAKDEDAAEAKAEEIVSDIMSNTILDWKVTTDIKKYKNLDWGLEVNEEDVEDQTVIEE